jgi:hypothetical protein
MAKRPRRISPQAVEPGLALSEHKWRSALVASARRQSSRAWRFQNIKKAAFRRLASSRESNQLPSGNHIKTTTKTTKQPQAITWRTLRENTI